MAFHVQEVIDREGYLWHRLYAMPKVELHRHLEGSIRLETLVDEARRHKIPLPSYDLESLRPFVQMTADDPADHTRFMEKFGVLRQFFHDQRVIQRVVREAIQDAAADNIRYMELRFTPFALAKLKGYPITEVMEWVTDVVELAQSVYNIQVRLIVSVNRHESLEIAEEVFQAAVDFKHHGVVGVDLAGKELGFPARPFAPLFREIKKEGLGVTIHAGEWVGPENVKEAVSTLKADRIGHGVRMVEDSQVVQIARERNVCFEVCPTSNIQTGSVGLVGHHPVLDLHYLNMDVTINTDDPTVCQTTLTDEYALAVEGLGMTLHHIQDMTLTAARRSFLPKEEKDILLTKLRHEIGIDRYRGLEQR